MSGRPILAGTTNVSTIIRIVDAADGTPETGVIHTTTGIDLRYRRDVPPGTTPLGTVAITEAALASLTTAHADGGIEHIDSGYYRLDVPDAAFATGADGVWIGGVITDMVVIGTYHPLVTFDPYGTEAENLMKSAAGIIPGLAQTGTLSTTQCSTDLSGYLADELVDSEIIFTGGTAAGQRSKITAYAVTNGVLTFDAIQTAPANNDPFILV